MASKTFVQPAIPHFDGHHDHWSMLMESFLRSKEYWNVVESGAIDWTILETILCKDTCKQIWDSMKKKYQGTTKTKRQQLQALCSEFEILQMKKGETVTDYFSRTMAIVNKLRAHGDRTQDGANDLDEMSLDELESSLLVYERKLNRQDKDELALKVKEGDVANFTQQLTSQSLQASLLLSAIKATVFEEATKESKWQKAIDEEIAAIERNNTWELTELPKGKKAIGVKWVYKTKLKENGEIDKYKARLVAKAQNSWPLYQLDVESAFLHGDLDEEVFIHQTPGYVKVGNEHKVYKLKRALYGLKQAPRAWYSRIESYFLKEGFQKCPYEHTLFIKSEGGKMLIVYLYVDDLIYTGNDMVMFDKFKNSMMAKFEMSDLGLMHYYLGIEVNQSAAGFFISQKKYVQDILDTFRMKNCNLVSTPIELGLKLVRNPGGMEINSTLYKQIVGSLMYLTATRLDIMHAVSLISRYMNCPKEVHLLATKRILRYLQGTVEYGLFYENGEKSNLFGFTDSDFARDLDDRKSTSGYVFIMGTTAISWTSREQSIVTLSTTEAEFVAATTCDFQAIWLRKVPEELHVKQEGPMLIFCDNNSTIKLSKNPILHGRCKHMDVEFHFLRDLTNEGVIDLIYCRTKDQIANIFAKPLKLSAFRRQRELLTVCTFDNH
ncbi:hypothetical protein SLEP1_g7421 [Rubroshorea leprosula]|uniref:Reverse transcriptase Ty1/copia-type domain-containing protein n=1 Tax=Rubroshorea leprosula TaxID=152421 RepID=A0AAV5HYB8_9ROSI|nr:hypothetical protein SLEP1_g7421 [Rubroshorea leprosula]